MQNDLTVMFLLLPFLSPPSYSIIHSFIHSFLPHFSICQDAIWGKKFKGRVNCTQFLGGDTLLTATSRGLIFIWQGSSLVFPTVQNCAMTEEGTPLSGFEKEQSTQRVVFGNPHESSILSIWCGSKSSDSPESASDSHGPVKVTIG